MLKYRKNLVILILSCIIYFIFSFVNNKFIQNENYTQAYILKTNVKKGDIFYDNMVKILYVKNADYSLDISALKNKVFKEDYSQRQLLDESMLIDKSVYLKTSADNTELVSIKLNNIEDSVSNNVTKGSIVNIYYTSKTIQAKDILEKFNVESLQSGSNQDGYITVKLLHNVKILELYNKDGISLVSNYNDNKSISDKLVHTIVIELNQNEVMKICNLKQYGEFTVSLVS